MSDEFAEAMSHRIRRFRKELGWSQEQLAEKIGVSRSLICCYENAKYSPNCFSLVRLAEALGVTTGELLGSTSRDVFEELEDLLPRLPSDHEQLRHSIHSYLERHELGKRARKRPGPSSRRD